jgi:uncharacterized protein YydD (DUF2326 family)
MSRIRENFFESEGFYRKLIPNRGEYEQTTILQDTRAMKESYCDIREE